MSSPASAAGGHVRRRLTILGVLVAAAAAVIVVVAIAAGGGDDGPPRAAAPSSGAAVTGAADTAAMLDGIPQSGRTLGKASAPVTMIEFADLQCPFCREFALQSLPRVVQDYVRTGKVKIELRLLTFLGPDSVRGAGVANLAARQGKLWNVAELFFHNQGREQTGYATDAFLKRIAGAVPGLDRAPLFATAPSDTPTEADAAADAAAARYGVTGTPSLVVGPTGGTLKLVDGFDTASVTAALDAAAAAS